MNKINLQSSKRVESCLTVAIPFGLCTAVYYLYTTTAADKLFLPDNLLLPQKSNDAGLSQVLVLGSLLHTSNCVDERQKTQMLWSKRKVRPIPDIMSAEQEIKVTESLEVSEEVAKA
ncbi:hypothetical protein E5288_WYG022781 [Bos mutus]|uniref:Uncharacterized protein n=1 Tax=Bos mutus TaxID=72004 RepID=A0A6B0R4J0_9CETA|nr:hypothetical protein [Bos mutus]